MSCHHVIKSWYHHVINLSYSQIIIYHAKITHKYKKYKIRWNITIPQLWGRDYKNWLSSRPKISLDIFLPRPRGEIYCYFILLLGWMPNNIFLTNIMCPWFVYFQLLWTFNNYQVLNLCYNYYNSISIIITTSCWGQSTINSYHHHHLMCPWFMWFFMFTMLVFSI